MSGHYHDPLGTYDYCDDPRCPRAGSDRSEQPPQPARSTAIMSERNGYPLRHIAYAYPDGTGFGDHYVTKDPALGTADQFDITVFPHGDNRLPHGDPLCTVPHVRIRTWNGPGQDWQVVSRTPIGKG